MAVQRLRAATLLLLLALLGQHAGSVWITFDAGECCPGVAEKGSAGSHPCTSLVPSDCCEPSAPLPAAHAGAPSPSAGAELGLLVAPPPLRPEASLAALPASRLAARSVVLRL
jgi:hypothetical protein